ncbi:glycoside hydrolase family 16 protein [Russula aff. rugulosa BPL654]|nr:glycoside hydrolase family 16 protein [Russula aff. rugulosa BPL654]
MLFLFFVFGALISPTSSVATFNAAVFSPPARFPYSSVDRYQGRDFLNESLWSYFTGSDPTGGQVNFLSRANAQKKGLAYVQGDNRAVLRVDSWTNLPHGRPRDSIRIVSMKTFYHGLVIADFDGMPFGCSVWPSLWSVGPNWPHDGEIDIVEGVNNKKINQYTFHTGANQKCSIPNRAPIFKDGPAFMGTVMNTNCRSSSSSDTGCAFLDTHKSSFGQGFANAGGGAFALLWDSGGIRIWHFERQSIPYDVYSGYPDPDSWPTSNAFLSADNCAVDSFFSPQRLVLDITLCGGWASGDYPNSGCPGTCTQQVTTGRNYANAAWLINSITVYNS